MKKPNLHALAMIVTGLLVLVSTPAFGDDAQCQTIKVAATKVWLEKPSKKDKEKDKDKGDKDSPKDHDHGKGNDDKDDKGYDDDKGKDNKRHGGGQNHHPKHPRPDEDMSCDNDERSKDVFFVDADLDFANVGTFVVPDVIPVTEGKSRKADAVVLEMGVHDCDGFSGVVTCSYKRMKPAGKHHPRDEWSRYRFAGCSLPSVTPGKKVTGNALSLHVEGGGKNCPDNRTTVAFDLNACGVGEILPPAP